MPSTIQTNKEFVAAAGIAERDAFITVAIRRIVARMMEIPARKLIASTTVESVMQRAGSYSDWDSLVFAMEFEEQFNIDISCEEWEKGCESAKTAGYPNWFYNPDNYEPFSFLWKPFISSSPKKNMTIGEWTRIAVEIVLIPVREKIIPPDDWPRLESSDLESDAIVQRGPAHYAMFYAFGTIMGIAGIVALIMILALFYR